MTRSFGRYLSAREMVLAPAFFLKMSRQEN
jgi:hypothetical protein